MVGSYPAVNVAFQNPRHGHTISCCTMQLGKQTQLQPVTSGFSNKCKSHCQGYLVKLKLTQTIPRITLAQMLPPGLPQVPSPTFFSVGTHLSFFGFGCFFRDHSATPHIPRERTTFSRFLSLVPDST